MGGTGASGAEDVQGEHEGAPLWLSGEGEGEEGRPRRASGLQGRRGCSGWYWPGSEGAHGGGMEWQLWVGWFACNGQAPLGVLCCL